MCAKGNQSITKECRDAIRELEGTIHVSNKRMREFVDVCGSCVAKENEVDKEMMR